MKPKSVILLAVALGCGLVAMLGVQKALTKPEQKKAETVRVLVATTDISPGVPLDDMNTKFKEMAKTDVPPGAVTTPDQFADRSLRVGAVPDEIIMQAKLGEPGVYGASSEIPAGMRVVTVPVDLTKTHSGLIRPGDRVDVLLSYSVRSAGFGEVKKVRTVLEYIKVFATDNLRAGEAGGKGDMSEINAKNISLLVDPEQAKRLMMANSLGQLCLALRHKKDDEPVAGEAISMTDFEGLTASAGQEDDPFNPGENATARETLKAEIAPPAATEPAVAVEPPPQTWKVHIYAGGEHRVEEVTAPAELPAAI